MLQPYIEQCARQPRNAVAKLPPGALALAIDGGDAFAVDLNCPFQSLSDIHDCLTFRKNNSI
jgi:hypothetical protein